MRTTDWIVIVVVGLAMAGGVAAMALALSRRCLAAIDDGSKRLQRLQDGVERGTTDQARFRDTLVAEQRTLAAQVTALQEEIERHKAVLDPLPDRVEAVVPRFTVMEGRADVLEGDINEMRSLLEQAADALTRLEGRRVADRAELAAELGDLLQRHSAMMRAEIVAATADRLSSASRAAAKSRSS